MARRVFEYVLTLFLLWCGVWVALAVGAHVALPWALATLEARGWKAEARLLNVAGFPATLAAEFAAIDVRHPTQPYAWRGEALVLSAPPWNPLRLTLASETAQTVVTPWGRFALSAEAVAGTFALRPGLALAFSGAEIEVRGAALVASDGWRIEAEAARISLWRTWGESSTYDLSAAFANFSPARQHRRLVDRALHLPPVLEKLALEARLAYDKPWDRSAILDAAPRPTAVEIEAFALRWGEIAVDARGSLSIDEAGRPTGAIWLGTPDWRALLAFARVNNHVAPDAFLEATLAAFENKERPGALSLPLIFAVGTMWLGPIPLGAAPALQRQ
jgi:hypothetical protein